MVLGECSLRFGFFGKVLCFEVASWSFGVNILFGCFVSGMVVWGWFAERVLFVGQVGGFGFSLAFQVDSKSQDKHKAMLEVTI